MPCPPQGDSDITVAQGHWNPAFFRNPRGLQEFGTGQYAQFASEFLLIGSQHQVDHQGA